MRRGRILLFILACIAALAAICVCFPEDGLKLGKLEFRFPSLKEIMVGDAAEEDEGPSPEELLAAQKKAATAAEKAGFEQLIREDSVRFFLPGGNPAYFDGFFAALDEARRKPVRIMHYGDSQIEEDSISNIIRKDLQDRFGGGGPGMMPAGSYVTLTASGSASRGLRTYMIYGDGSRRARTNKYGPLGRFARIDTTVTFSLRSAMTRERPPRPRTYFNRAELLVGNLRGKLTVRCGGEKRVFPAGDTLRKISFALPDSSSRVSVTVSGHADIYGIMLGDSTGVSLDNVPMRGCSGTVFTKLDKDLLASFYGSERVRLILLQYGGNSVPYIKGPKAIHGYKEGIKKQIELFREVAPEASIVFLGPSDMSTTIKGHRQTYPHLPAFIDSLKLAAAETGIAYFDIYGAMGGKNSMVRWVNSKPALAGPDYVHFTPRGAEQMGELFVSSLMLYYDYYQWRKRNEK